MLSALSSFVPSYLEASVLAEAGRDDSMAVPLLSALLCCVGSELFSDVALMWGKRTFCSLAPVSSLRGHHPAGMVWSLWFGVSGGEGPSLCLRKAGLEGKQIIRAIERVPPHSPQALRKTRTTASELLTGA